MKMLETILCSLHSAVADHRCTVLYDAHSGDILALPRYISRDAGDIAGSQTGISYG